MIEVSKSTFYILTIFFTVLVCLVVFSDMAEAYEVPKDAVIKVFDANGKQIGEMKRSEYKVVKLGTSQEKIVYKYVKVKVPVQVKAESKHKLSLMAGGGVGNNGHDVSNNGQTYTITDDREAVGSLGACVTKDGQGVCFQGTSNDTYMMNFVIPLGDL